MRLASLLLCLFLASAACAQTKPSASSATQDSWAREDIPQAKATAQELGQTCQATERAFANPDIQLTDRRLGLSLLVLERWAKASFPERARCKPKLGQALGQYDFQFVIRQWQRAHGRPETGVIDEADFRSMEQFRLRERSASIAQTLAASALPASQAEPESPKPSLEDTAADRAAMQRRALAQLCPQVDALGADGKPDRKCQMLLLPSACGKVVDSRIELQRTAARSEAAVVQAKSRCDEFMRSGRNRAGEWWSTGHLALARKACGEHQNAISSAKADRDAVAAEGELMDFCQSQSAQSTPLAEVLESCKSAVADEVEGFFSAQVRRTPAHRWDTSTLDFFIKFLPAARANLTVLFNRYRHDAVFGKDFDERFCAKAKAQTAEEFRALADKLLSDAIEVRSRR